MDPKAREELLAVLGKGGLCLGLTSDMAIVEAVRLLVQRRDASRENAEERATKAERAEALATEDATSARLELKRMRSVLEELNVDFRAMQLYIGRSHRTPSDWQEVVSDQRALFADILRRDSRERREERERALVEQRMAEQRGFDTGVERAAFECESIAYHKDVESRNTALRLRTAIRALKGTSVRTSQTIKLRALLQEWTETPFFETREQWEAWVNDFGTRVHVALADTR